MQLMKILATNWTNLHIIPKCFQFLRRPSKVAMIALKFFHSSGMHNYGLVNILAYYGTVSLFGINQSDIYFTNYIKRFTKCYLL